MRFEETFFSCQVFADLSARDNGEKRWDLIYNFVTKGATMGTWRPSRNITLSRSPRINGASIN